MFLPKSLIQWAVTERALLHSFHSAEVTNVCKGALCRLKRFPQKSPMFWQQSFIQWAVTERALMHSFDSALVTNICKDTLCRFKRFPQKSPMFLQQSFIQWAVTERALLHSCWSALGTTICKSALCRFQRFPQKSPIFPKNPEQRALEEHHAAVQEWVGYRQLLKSQRCSDFGQSYCRERDFQNVYRSRVHEGVFRWKFSNASVLLNRSCTTTIALIFEKFYDFLLFTHGWLWGGYDQQAP